VHPIDCRRPNPDTRHVTMLHGIDPIGGLGICQVPYPRIMPELNPRAPTLSVASSSLSSKSRSTNESARQPSTLITPDRVVLHRQRSECINIHRLARQMLRGNKARLTSSTRTAPGSASPSRKASFSSPFNTRHFSRRDAKAWFQLNWDRHGGKRCRIGWIPHQEILT